MTTLWKRGDYDAATAADAVEAADAARRTADARWVDAVTGAPTTSPEEDAQAERAAERGDANMSGAAHRARIAARIRGAAASRRAHIDASQNAARSYLSAREEEELDALEASLRAKQQTPQTDPWADSHGGPARTPTPTPTTPTPLERLVAMYGAEVAFKMWAASRTPRRDRYSDAYRAALKARNDALHTERDAIADAKVARLARRAAAADVADARAKVALALATIARARI